MVFNAVPGKRGIGCDQGVDLMFTQQVGDYRNRLLIEVGRQFQRQRSAQLVSILQFEAQLSDTGEQGFECILAL